MLSNFTRGTSGSELNINVDSTDLTASATVEKGSVSFFNKKGIRYPISSTCDRVFKETAGGSLFDFSFSMDPAASKLKMILKRVSFTKKDDLMASWIIPTIIFMAILAVFLIVGGLFLVCFIRQRKATAKRAKDQVAKTLLHLF